MIPDAVVSAIKLAVALEEDDSFIETLRKVTVTSIAACSLVVNVPLSGYWIWYSAAVLRDPLSPQALLSLFFTIYFNIIGGWMYWRMRKMRSVDDASIIALTVGGQFVCLLVGVVSWLPATPTYVLVLCLAASTGKLGGGLIVFAVGAVGMIYSAVKTAWPKETTIRPVIASQAELFLTSLVGLGTYTVAGILIVTIRLAFFVEQEKAAKRQRNNDTAPKDPSKPFAVVFTDIESSTRLWAAVPQEMGTALETHNSVIRQAIASYNGYEVKTIGDSFMVVFTNAVDAVGMALTVQTRLLECQWGSGVIDDFYRQKAAAEGHPQGKDGPLWSGLRVRIGVHFGHGDVKYDDVSKGYDYFGTVVNTASRVESAAHGGQIAITAPVRDALVAAAPAYVHPISNDPVVFRPLGRVELRGLPDPLELVQISSSPLARRSFPLLRAPLEAEVEAVALVTGVPPTPGSSESDDGGSSRAGPHSSATSVRPVTVSAQFLETLLSVEPNTEERLKAAKKLVSSWRLPWIRLSASKQAHDVERDISCNIGALGVKVERVMMVRYPQLNPSTMGSARVVAHSSDLGSGMAEASSHMSLLGAGQGDAQGLSPVDTTLSR